MRGGKLNGKGQKTREMGIKIYRRPPKKKSGLDVRFPKTRGKFGEMKEEIWTCAELIEN